MPKPTRAKSANRYSAILERIFLKRFAPGATEVPFSRQDLVSTARALRLKLPKNLGDIVYALRYRVALPASIRATQPEDSEWIIEGAGRAEYVFRLSRQSRLAPNPHLVTIKVPDATPEIVVAFAQSDEQALLGKVRYNRLVDIFLGLTAYSLQNHLRTAVTGIGQIEIDELYVGVDRFGCQFVIPVQAKGGSDQLSPVQTKQDLACCRTRFPQLLCRAVSAQFMADDLIAMFELRLVEDQIKVVDEKHYRLVPADDITHDDLRSYAAAGAKDRSDL
jgi:hypothetical protein